MLSSSRSHSMSTLLLAVAASLPFLPALAQFLWFGVPDILFTGDGAALELRVLQAAHGVQFVGPYSPQGWSHPGPAFFYLAAPLYELAGERGPALNLFVLLVNLGVTLVIVKIARTLAGDLVALAVAALVGVHVLVAAPFVPAGEWNLTTPVLPLLLLSLLTARLVLEITAALPWFVFLASAIVQTHVGYLPEVLALSAVVGVALIWRLVPIDGTASAAPPRPSLLIASAAVAALCWCLPLYEAVRNNPNNLQQVFLSFTAPGANGHTWGEALSAVTEQVAVVPMALVRTVLPFIGSAPQSVSRVLTAALIAALVLTLITAARRRERVVALLAGIALLEIVVAVAAVRAIRGPIEAPLLFWVPVPAVLACIAIAAWLARRVVNERRPSAARFFRFVVVIWLAAALLAPKADVYRPRSTLIEALARTVEHHLRTSGPEPPVITIASTDSWPAALGVILHLRKQRLPFYVDPAWTFMTLPSLTPPAGEHPALLFGDDTFQQAARSRSGPAHLASAGEVHVWVDQRWLPSK